MKTPAAARVPQGGFPPSHRFPIILSDLLFESIPAPSTSPPDFCRGYRGRPESTPGQGGFTLLELLTVIAIMAVLAGISGAGLCRGLPERRLMSASRTVYCDLRKAQALAVSRGDRIAVNFSPEAETISLTDPDGRLLSRTLLPGYIDLYNVTGDSENENQFVFNSRGMKTGVSGSVQLRYRRPGYAQCRVMVRSAGSMIVQRSIDDGKTWE